MQIKIVPSNFIEANVRSVVKELRKTPIVGTNKFFGFNMKIYGKDGSTHLVLRDGTKLVGYMELVDKVIDIGVNDWIPVKQTHSFLTKPYRGRGLAIRLYEWAAKRWTLISSPSHTAGANNVWRKLSEKHPVLCVRCDNKKNYKYKIVSELNRRQFKDTLKYQIVVGDFVNWDNG